MQTNKRKKKFFKIIMLGVIFISVLSISFKKEKTISHVYNPNLDIVKEGWKGNVLINDEFHNDSIQEKRSMWKALKWKLSSNPQKQEKKNDTFKITTMPITNTSKETDNIIWLGHSSFIITINGVKIATDPCFFDLPMSKERKVAFPNDYSILDSIDYVLVSHNHFDHFDTKSAEIIAQINPNVEALLPLNVGTLFNSEILKGIKKQEAGWYQEYKLSSDIRIIFLPARHWSRRGVFDFNKSLWGSFLILTNNKKIFFSGDTAYNKKMFKDIHKLFGDIDICLLPIGAYAPRNMMETSHTTPEEAFNIFNDLGGKLFIPMHYGTFDLSDEPIGEPIRLLKNIFEGDNRKLNVLSVGEEFLIK